VSTKPYNPGAKKVGFLDDDPEFTLCEVNPNHKLILNKFCWVRPQMILHTKDFQHQTDALTLTDLEAALDVLNQLGDRYLVIFNGGPDAGSSVSHKHMQIFLKPDWKMVADEIAQGTTDGEQYIYGCITKADPIASLPFQYRLTKLPTSRSPDVAYEFYKAMCAEMHIASGRAHGMLLTKEWIMVVPRTTANIAGEIENAPLQGGANAMIGMLWLKSQAQLENWKQYGPMKALRDFGVAVDAQTNGI